jgi:hypothetical protein
MTRRVVAAPAVIEPSATRRLTDTTGLMWLDDSMGFWTPGSVRRHMYETPNQPSGLAKPGAFRGESEVDQILADARARGILFAAEYDRHEPAIGR